MTQYPGGISKGARTFTAEAPGPGNGVIFADQNALKSWLLWHVVDHILTKRIMLGELVNSGQRVR